MILFLISWGWIGKLALAFVVLGGYAWYKWGVWSLMKEQSTEGWKLITTVEAAVTFAFAATCVLWFLLHQQ
jgi:hypothetical protein